jgi:hypothetical protein
MLMLNELATQAGDLASIIAWTTHEGPLYNPQ